MLADPAFDLLAEALRITPVKLTGGVLVPGLQLIDKLCDFLSTRHAGISRTTTGSAKPAAH
jgi:hypothetical protein